MTPSQRQRLIIELQKNLAQQTTGSGGKYWDSVISTIDHVLKEKEVPHLPEEISDLDSRNTFIASHAVNVLIRYLKYQQDKQV